MVDTVTLDEATAPAGVDIVITAGDAVEDSDAGLSASIHGGNATITGVGGDVQLYSGYGGSTSGDGGGIVLAAGNALADGQGGAIHLTAGNAAGEHDGGVAGMQ